MKSNNLAQTNLLLALTNVTIVLFFTYRKSFIKKFFVAHRYKKEPKGASEQWDFYFSLPLNSANGICMWRILSSIPLAIIAGTFYDNTIVTMICFQFYTFLFTTDATDGEVARGLENITPIGKTLDPLADKILDLPVLLIVCVYSYNPYFILISVLIIAIDILGQLARGGMSNPAASWIGKTKTIIKIITIIFMSFSMFGYYSTWISGILLMTTLIFTFWSFYSKVTIKMKKDCINYIKSFC